MHQLPCHHITEEKFGEARRYTSSNGSSLEFASNGVCYTLVWTTKGPPVLALRTVLQHELTEKQLVTAYFLYGRPRQTRIEPGSPEIVQEFFDFTDAYERSPDDPATQFDSVRFDLPPRAIMLASLDPDFSFTGMCYLINHTNSQALAADVQAMRRAFLDTADESLKSELDWALGPNLR
jgi:hypothetical protein